MLVSFTTLLPVLQMMAVWNLDQKKKKKDVTKQKKYFDIGCLKVLFWTLGIARLSYPSENRSSQIIVGIIKGSELSHVILKQVLVTDAIETWLISIGIPIVEIRQSVDRLISITGIPILTSRALYWISRLVSDKDIYCMLWYSPLLPLRCHAICVVQGRGGGRKRLH